ncbi:hypothetical protein AZ34_01880 [Hylemonella gracilis str. Niagara R]|uniref:Porin n=1 Tax=Hylemonella gracilis str. Niagara R TaxID=1458275 RepID=A0A016XFF4_9BURK|nr:DUF3138 family protein [Hylemonella gracilis]EYC49948.1 hypothetical protein AZ34_01880 [Hylemonella gracilis str. Niagara R]
MRVKHRTIFAPVAALALGLAAGGQAIAQQNRMGLTPDQMQDLNRTIVKTEAIEDAWETAGFKGLTISGYMDPTYIYNQNADRAGFQFLSTQGDGDAWDYSDTYYFGTASISFEKEADDGTQYVLKLQPQSSNSLNLAEAKVSIPLSNRQTRLIAGQVLDWSGYEYADPVQTSLITHNLLFDFTLPVSYTGAGFDISTGSWQFRTMLANVNSATAPADEKSPSWVYRFDYWPEEFWGVGFAGLVGKTVNYNDPDEALSNTILFEVDGYYARGDWSLGGQISYGTQEEAAVNGKDAQWVGASATVAYNITPRLLFALRADYIQNEENGGGLFGYQADTSNGIGDADGDDKGANRYATSLGLKYLLNEKTSLKLEYRLDGASEDVFEDVDGKAKDSNNVFGAAIVVSF